MIGTIYKCEIRSTKSSAPNHWFVIHRSDARLMVCKWAHGEADQPRALHFCGEAHAQANIGRWFQPFCGSSELRTQR